MSNEINLLGFKHDMIFVLNKYRVLFHSLLLNDDNKYWHNWFNSPNVGGSNIKVYKCSDNWSIEALIDVLKHIAGLKGVATENTHAQIYQLKITLGNFDKIYEIAHEINDYIIMKKVCQFIKLEITEDTNRKINCKFLDQLMPNELITEINDSWSVIDFENQTVKSLSKIRFDSEQKNIVKKLYNTLWRFNINETELLEFLLFINPKIADKPISPEMFRNIIKWKL